MEKKKWARQALELLRSLLPETAKIPIISLTGSRAFGWGGEGYDIDLRAVIACRGYWDTFHHGQIFDLNCEELEHLFGQLYYRHWTPFEDLANPIHLMDEFHYEEFMDLCSADNVRCHLFTIKTQIAQAEIANTVRPTLHAYRLTLVPLHFLKTGEIQVHVPTLAEIYNVKYFEALADSYRRRQQFKGDLKPALEEVHRLLRTLLNELERSTSHFEKEKVERWKATVIAELY